MTSYFAPRYVWNAKVMALEMQSLFLSGRIFPFGAKLTVDHVFRSSEKVPVEVIYSFPLPRDASLTGFQITGKNFSVSSRLETVADAKQRYEEALEQGSLAAVTQQNVDGQVNLTVGNLLPGETVAVRLDLIAGLSLNDSGFRLRFPFTMAPTYHPHMRVSSDFRGVGNIDLPDQVAGGVFQPPFHEDASELHSIGFDLRVEPSPGVQEIASPSHALRLAFDGHGGVNARLCPDRDVPDRDLILDVKQPSSTGRAWSDRSCDGRKHFAVIAPSTLFGEKKTAPRRTVFLLDRSGSMEGSPIKQARQALENCLRKLSQHDEFGVVVFGNAAEPFHQTLLPATLDNIEDGCSFLHGIHAQGGTELARGIEAATSLLGSPGGEIFVVTDGQVSETVEILRRAHKCETRLFCLGIGSASQDRFLELLARQTGGVCRFVSPVERIEGAADDLFAAMGGGVAAGVSVARANTQAHGNVFVGTPFFSLGEIDAEDPAAVISWTHGSRVVPFEPLPDEMQGLIEKLLGARMIADLETHYDRSDAHARQQLIQLSKRYGLASSEMSLVAVVERMSDEPGELPRTKVVPVGMPQGTEFRSYFGRKIPVVSQTARMPLSSRASSPMMIIETSQPVRKRARLHRAPLATHASPPVESDLRVIIHEAITLIDQHASIRDRQDINIALEGLLRALVSSEPAVKDGVKRAALSELIGFLSRDVVSFLETGIFDEAKWTSLRNRLQSSWPSEKSGVQEGNTLTAC